MYVSPEITNLFMRFWFQFELCVNDSSKHIIKKTIDSKRKWLEDVNNNGYRTQNIGYLHIWNKWFSTNTKKKQRNKSESSTRAFHYSQFIIVCWWFLSRCFERDHLRPEKWLWWKNLGHTSKFHSKHSICRSSLFYLFSLFLVFVYLFFRCFSKFNFFSIFQFLFSKDFLTHEIFQP